MTTSERLKVVRDMYGHSQAKVAAAINIKQKTYQAYERGRAEAPIRVLIALSEFYGYYSIDLLLDLRNEIDLREGITKAYREASPENRRIIDFILKQKH